MDSTKNMRDPHGKFVELANKRVSKAIKDIRLIGNLGNRSLYKYSDHEIRKIFSALSAEIKASRARFGAKSEDRKEEIFKL